MLELIGDPISFYISISIFSLSFCNSSGRLAYLTSFNSRIEVWGDFIFDMFDLGVLSSIDTFSKGDF